MFGKKKQNKEFDAQAIKEDFHHKQTDLYESSESKYKTSSQIEAALMLVYPKVMEDIDINEASSLSTEELINHVRPIISQVLNSEKIQLNAQEQAILEKRINDDMVGLGPIEVLLADDDINDILVNGTKNIYIERHGKLEAVPFNFRDDAHVMNVISRIVSAIGRRIDESNPFVDARLKDGSRVNAIIPPLTLDGPALSIRKFKKQTIDLQDMVGTGNLSQSMAEILSIATQCRLNIIVLGGTGSGKTTLLNALSHHIPEDERIITIEDSAELQLQQPHIVRLETKPANIEGKGAITERDLVKNALRMRPDRIILGEIRSGEAFDMLQAMNTGHDGSMCTIHASSAREVPARLGNMVLMSGYEFPSEAILSQIASSVNLLVETTRMRDGRRRVTSITEIVGLEQKIITMQELYSFQVQGEDLDGYLKGEFVFNGIKPKFSEVAKNYGLIEQLNRALNL